MLGQRCCYSPRVLVESHVDQGRERHAVTGRGKGAEMLGNTQGTVGLVTGKAGDIQFGPATVVCLTL